MKKLLLFLTLVVLTTFASCTKGTTYTFTDNMDYSGFSIQERTVLLKEYDSNGSLVGDNTLESPVEGKTYVFIPNDRAEMVKVNLNVQYQNGEIRNGWVQQVYSLEKEGNVDIVLDGNTMMGSSEP